MEDRVTTLETAVYGRRDPQTGVRDLGIADKVNMIWRFGTIIWAIFWCSSGIAGTLFVQSMLRGGIAVP